MALEDLTGTKYINSLVATNPTSSDNKSEGDDHIRGVKNVLLKTFPNVTGAVTPTHTELNYVDGVTSAIQTQLDAKVATAGLLTAILAVDGTGSGIDSDKVDGFNVYAGTLASPPSGWSVNTSATGREVVTHNFGTTSYIVIPVVYEDGSLPGAIFCTVNRSANSFEVQTRTSTSGAYTDAGGVMFIVVKA